MQLSHYGLNYIFFHIVPVLIWEYFKMTKTVNILKLLFFPQKKIFKFGSL